MNHRATEDQQFMSLALRLGKRGQGKTTPNPSVGCILVKNNKIIGRGFTQPGGQPHAEVMALSSSREDPLGATAYVTLEPCCHQGKSPPCTQSLIQAGITRVVIATLDPNPLVSGKGLITLKENGIEVSVGCLEDQAKRHHQGFLLSMTQKRPQVTLKLAMTLDGKVATSTGQSKWITSVQSRRRVHQLRAQSDAILIGSGTVIADDPTLNQRIMTTHGTPARFILDSHLVTPLHSKIGQSIKSIQTYFFHIESVDTSRISQWKQLGAHLISSPCDPNTQIDLNFALKQIVQLGYSSVLCEGGPRVASSLIQNDYVDRFISFTAGKAFGSQALPSIGFLSYSEVEDAPQFELERVDTIDGDVVSYWSKLN